MDDDHAAHHQHAPAERPTDRACPGCRVCACYETESDRRATDETDDRAESPITTITPATVRTTTAAQTTTTVQWSTTRGTRRCSDDGSSCLALAVPVLYYSTTLQSWLGFAAIGFTGSEFIAPAFGLLVFGYGAYRSSGWGPSRLTTGSQG